MDTTAPAATGQKKILWVEDDAFLNSMIGKRLVKEQFDVSHARDGETAFSLIAAQHPDIIMLDILLPGMDGVEILRRLKGDPATKAIPVLMFSNLNDKVRIDECKELGAVGFFVKAYVTLDEILAVIRKTLGMPVPEGEADIVPAEAKPLGAV